MSSANITDTELEQKVLARGQQLLAAFTAYSTRSSNVYQKLEHRLEQWLADDQARVQVLRFIDVLPVLTEDRDIVQHVREYFGHDFPLPSSLQWVLHHSHNAVTEAVIARTVKTIVRRMARRFISGSNNEEIWQTVTALRQRHTGFSLDLLGEAVVSEAEADAYQQRYLGLLQTLSPRVQTWPAEPLLDHDNGKALPRLNLSLKLSSLYSQLTPLSPETSIEGIAERLRPILRLAYSQGAFIYIDMEQYDYKNLTPSCFKSLLMEPEFRDWPDIGIALQAYLKDTEQDLQELIDWVRERDTPISVRLVRGAYWDTETIIARRQDWPSPVWATKPETDASYERCLQLLFVNHSLIYPAVGTHNIRSLALAMTLAEAHKLTPEQFEVQLLYGMTPALESAIPHLGYRLRVYLPFGELLPGMAYLVRRLLENSSSQSFQRLHLSGGITPETLLAAPSPLFPHPVGENRDEENGTPPNKIFTNISLHRFTGPQERDQFQHALNRVRLGLGIVYPLLIDGYKFDTGHYITSVNPANPQEIIGKVAQAEPAHVDMAVRGAGEAGRSWTALSVRARAGVLRQIANLLTQRRDEFAAFEILEAGKTWDEADANVTEAIDYLHYYADEAERLSEPRHWNVAGEANWHGYRARGVGVIIPPWNFPLAILVGMLSAAVVTGNTVILKPSSQTPVIAAHFVALIQEAGLPPGVVQFLPASGSAIGDYLVQHPGVHFIAFTGSEAIGTRIVRLVAEQSPGQRHVKHVIAEMGGKNAIIVDSDADLDDAVLGIAHSAFGYQGQKCSACSRTIVVGGHYTRYLERLVAATDSLIMGDPVEPQIYLGPVIDARARDRIMAMINSGQQLARLVYRRCSVPAGMGYWVGPAIFGEVPPEAFLAQEEIFGPVLAVMPAGSLEAAIALANNTRYALTGGIFSRSPANVDRVRQAFAVGNLYINRKITGALVGRQPFGGFNMSGLGSQAGGRDYLLQFMIPRTVTENTVRRGFAPVSSKF